MYVVVTMIESTANYLLVYHISFTMLALLVLLVAVCLPCIVSRFSVFKCTGISTASAPPSYPIIGCLTAYYRNRRRLLDWYTDLLSSSPSQTTVIKRMGARRVVITANPDSVEYILKTNFANFPKGKPFSDLLGDLLGRGIFNTDGELWSAQRKLASHEFNVSTLKEFVVSTLHELVDNRLLPLMEEAAVKGVVLDLQEVLRRFAFDSACKVLLGIDSSSLDVSKPVPKLVKAFDEASTICARRGVASMQLVWKLKRFLNVGEERKLKEAVKLVHDSVLEIIKTKKMAREKSRTEKGSSSRYGSDLLSRLLSVDQEEEVIRDMVISFIMAGRDTTSSAMTWLFWLLSYHQDVQDAVVKETQAALMLNAKHSGQTNPLNFEVLKEMNYLKACLCESMRLYPPVAWDSKHALNDDVLPDGTFVRKGDRVTYFPYGMGRMETLWGKDRLEFQPNRWLADSGSVRVLKPISPYKFPVFQAGPRVCLGREMAFIQMKYVVASILRRFRLKPTAGDQNHPLFVPLLTSQMAGGFKITVHFRE